MTKVDDASISGKGSHLSCVYSASRFVLLTHKCRPAKAVYCEMMCQALQQQRG